MLKHKLNLKKFIDLHEIIVTVREYSYRKYFILYLFLLEPARVKFPMYNEKDKCIPFDAGLLNKTKRQIIIRIHSNNIIYIFESDLGALKKLADGHRHRVLKKFSSFFLFIKIFVLVLFYAKSGSRNDY